MSDNKQVGEKPSSEVANRFGSCRDLSDIVPLYPPRFLYLKPLAKVNVSVSLPQLKTPGKNIIVKIHRWSPPLRLDHEPYVLSIFLFFLSIYCSFFLFLKNSSAIQRKLYSAALEFYKCTFILN